MQLKEIQIELTNACQSGCLMCSHRLMKRPVTHMDLNLFDKLIRESLEISADPYFVGICGIGEPLLHPQLKEALKLVSILPRWAIGTNGQALNKEKVEWLIDARFKDLTLSIDAISPEVHNKMRPGLSFTVVLENVLYLLGELKKQKKFWRNIYLQLILTKENEHEVNTFIDYWLTKTKYMEGVLVFIKPMYQWPGLDNPYYPGPHLEIRKDPRVLVGDFKNTSFRESCNLFDNWVLIQSDGAYQPCCMTIEDEFKVGNVKEHTILELYNSAKMNYYRSLFREKQFDKLPFCGGCK